MAALDRRRSSDQAFWLAYGLLLLAGLVLLFLLTLGEPRLRHWFVLPVALCLAIVGGDTANLLTGRTPLFSPLGLFGLLGVQFFFLAPLLHVYLDYWIGYTTPPADWRTWLGGMALLNALGLLAWHAGRRLSPPSDTGSSSGWTVNFAIFLPLGAVLLAVSFVLQTWIYALLGGITGYIQAYKAGQLSGESPFEGWGRLMMVAELFPFTAFMMVAALLKRTGGRLPLVATAGLLLGLFVLCLYFGGLRGSRSNTVWTMFWAVMVTHLWLRPIPKRLLAAGVLVLAGFMYVYGLYKGVGGATGLGEVLDGRMTLTELEERTDRPIEKVLLVDFGRADLQAVILQRLTTGAFEPVWGRTYLAALAMLVPQSLWPERPPNKMKEGSAMRFGAGAFEAGYVSWSVYGLAGEAMLNFGPFAVLGAFLLYGILMARLHAFVTALPQGDARILLAPFVVILSVNLLTSDLDNILWFVCKTAALPSLFVYLGTRQHMAWRGPSRIAAG